MSERTFPIAVHESWEWTGHEDAMLADLRAGATEALEALEPAKCRVEAAAFIGEGDVPGVRATIQRPGQEQRTVELWFSPAPMDDVRAGARKLVEYALERRPEDWMEPQGTVEYEPDDA